MDIRSKTFHTIIPMGATSVELVPFVYYATESETFDAQSNENVELNTTDCAPFIPLKYCNKKIKENANKTIKSEPKFDDFHLFFV